MSKATPEAPNETPAAAEEQVSAEEPKQPAYTNTAWYHDSVYGIWNGNRWEKDHNGRVLLSDCKAAMMAELHNLRMSDHLNTSIKSRLCVEEIGEDGLPVPTPEPETAEDAAAEE